MRPSSGNCSFLAGGRSRSWNGRQDRPLVLHYITEQGADGVETAGEQRVPEQAGGGVREAAARRPGKEVVIDVRGVVWERDGRRILDHVDWTVRPGEHWALLGRNGSGETTLLSMITGYVRPMRGRAPAPGHRHGTAGPRG